MTYIKFTFKNNSYAIGRLFSKIGTDNWANIEIVKPYNGKNETLRKYYTKGRKFQADTTSTSDYDKTLFVDPESHPEYFI